MQALKLWLKKNLLILASYSVLFSIHMQWYCCDDTAKEVIVRPPRYVYDESHATNLKFDFPNWPVSLMEKCQRNEMSCHESFPKVEDMMYANNYWQVKGFGGTTSLFIHSISTKDFPPCFLPLLV